MQKYVHTRVCALKRGAMMENLELNIAEMLQEPLTNLVNSLKDDEDVKTIILFGSYAYGNPNTDSDLDIAIISDRSFNELSETSKKIRKKLRRKIGMPMDLLIFNYERFMARVQEGFSFETEIFEKGVRLYG